jgi:CheY-like chemotaxis protein
MTSTKTVLVIDDDNGTTDVFARLLRAEGFHVRTALSAERGLQEVQRMPLPDAILVDFRMPFVDGLGFLYRLRSHPAYQDIPVAIVTGDYALDDVVAQELTQLGARLHFKPVWLEDILAIANALTAERRCPNPPLPLRH